MTDPAQPDPAGQPGSPPWSQPSQPGQPGSAPPPTGGYPGSAAPPPGQPGSAPPPPGGYPGWTPGYAEPPLTSFARRNNLVRPVHGRMFAGVCAAFGRATNTDPILWRVVLVVLTVFGGVGLFVYLLAWLLLPADGDSASPVEAILGRGRSRTSGLLTVLAGVFLLLTLGVLVGEHPQPGLFGVLLLGGALLLLLRDQRVRSRTAADQPWAMAGPGSSPPGGPASTAGPAGPMPTTQTGGPAMSTGVASAPPGAPGPPFAPYGPYGGATGYPSTTQPPPVPPPTGFGPAYPPVPPIPPPRSRLGRLTLSILLVLIGVLALVDLSGGSIGAGWYLAAALATVGLALLVSAWFGRARGLIALGIVLSVALVAVGAHHHWQGWHSAGDQTWRPAVVSEIQPRYQQDLGDAQLDLSDVDFSGQEILIRVEVSVGNLAIQLPPDVDATVRANVGTGSADVFSEHWGGVGLRERTVTDLGKDGPGGGTVTIDANVDLGNLEVTR